MKSFINHLLDFLGKRSKPILGLTALCMLLSLIGIFQTKIDTSFSLFAPGRSSYEQGSELMKEMFGDTNQMLVLIPGKEEPDDIRRTASLIGDLSDTDGISMAIGPVPADMAAASDESINAYVAALPKIGGLPNFVKAGQTDYIALKLQMSEAASLRRTVDAVESLLLEKAPGSILSGEPYLESKIFDYVLRILLILPPMAIFLMLGVFRLRIGSFRATALSMVPAIIGAILTLGALCWIRGNISIMSVLVPIFIIILGSADGLHVTSHVMDQLGLGKSKREAIEETLTAVGIPIILTTLTTMAGFLSLLVINSPAIREMAITSTGGILLAGLVTWIILPLLLMHQKPLPARDHQRKSRLTDFIWKMKGVPVIVFAIVIVAVAVPGLFKLKADFSMVEMYKPQTEVRTSLETISEATGGAFPLYILLDAEHPLSPETANAVLDFQNNLADSGVIVSSISLYSVIDAAMQQKGLGDGYPQSAQQAAMLVKILSNVEPEMIGNFFTKDRYLRLLLYVPSLDTGNLRYIVEQTDVLSQMDGLKAYPVGSAFGIMDMNLLIIPQQLQSTIIALLLVIVLTAISLRSLKLGLAAVFPILITLVGLYAVMGYFAIDISIITCIMSGMTIGVGIDYAIHYTSVFRFLQKKGSEHPAEEAVKFVATPVLANALGLSIGFTVMIFSPLQIHTTLAILMWVTMLLSALLSLSLLPTLLGKKT